MITWLKESFKGMIGFLYAVNVIISALVGLTIGNMLGNDEGPAFIGLLIGAAIGAIIGVAIYGFFSTVIDIADKQDKLLKALSANLTQEQRDAISNIKKDDADSFAPVTEIKKEIEEPPYKPVISDKQWYIIFAVVIVIFMVICFAMTMN